jgi:hypothetical protein
MTLTPEDKRYLDDTYRDEMLELIKQQARYYQEMEEFKEKLKQDEWLEEQGQSWDISTASKDSHRREIERLYGLIQDMKTERRKVRKLIREMKENS